MLHERDIFLAALEITDATARRAYLDGVCADDATLRARVEFLLKCAGTAGDFLEQPAADLCAEVAPHLSSQLHQARSEPVDPPTHVGEDDTGRTIVGPPVIPGSSVGPVPVMEVLFGRYRVERMLGSGGMGVVYLAEDLRLGRRVALKIPRFDADGTLHLSQRFRREARTMASVVHRNLCPIYDVDEQGGTHYLTMAFIDGEPLSQQIKQGKTFTSRQIAELIQKLALAIDVAHRAGIVHRDLKPANVMIDRSGEPVLLDFGLAWLAHESDSRVTQSGAVMGTPAYMSPEQASGEPELVGPASDIYSLGAILYELLAGQPVHTGGMTRVLFKLVHDAPIRPGELRGNVDPRLEAICLKAISRQPADRFSTAAEFAAACSDFLSKQAENQAPAEPTAKPHPSNGDSPTLSITVSPRRPEGGFRDQKALAAKSILGARWPAVMLSLLLFGVIGAIWSMTTRTPKTGITNPVVPLASNTGKHTNPAVDSIRQPLPVDAGKPFVLIRTGSDVRAYKTLAAAMDARQPEDLIEIRSHNRLSIQLAEPVRKPLTLRAGTGYRPLLAFVGLPKSCQVEHDFSVEGCDLDFRSRAVINVGRTATWRFHRCRLWGEPQGSISKINFTQCCLVSRWGITTMADGTATECELDNCLIRDRNFLLDVGGSGNHMLRLRNCTFLAVDGAHSRLVRMNGQTKLTVTATGNVFHCQSQANALIDPASMSQVKWHGADNCFSGTWYQIWDGNTIKLKGLTAWNKLLSEPERDSREVDWLRFEWGRIQRLANPDRTNAIRETSKNILAQLQRPEIGPDWNLVGPGAAYVRALAAVGRGVPESELRPERREDGPIVLLRDGKEVSGYLTLKPALDAARDKDVIELRTDGVVLDTRWKGDSRLLTIRAGAGYTPIIDASLESSGTDRLHLEGLTIRWNLSASGGVINKEPGRDKKPLFPTQGCIARMMNCMLLPVTAKSVADAWLIGEGESIPEIVNSNLGILRIGIPPGGTVRLRNSVFGDCRPNVDSPMAQPGRLEIEGCLFWLPEMEYNVWSASVISHSAISVQAQRSVFVSPIDLTWGHPRMVNWSGRGNLIMKSHGFYFGNPQTPLELEQFQKQFQTETDSIELPPWEFDPAQWRILRDESPGYRPRADGTDYGANIDVLVKALDGKINRAPKPTSAIARPEWVGWPIDAPRPAIAPFDAPQARQHQTAWAKHLGIPVEYTNSIGIRFVLIPPGEFTMGSSAEDIAAAVQEVGNTLDWVELIRSEGPRHKVQLTKPIYLSVHEVTQGEYMKLMGQGNNPSYFAPTGLGSVQVDGIDLLNHPVEMVTWTDAADFCVKLAQFEKLNPCYQRVGDALMPMEGAGYRLPSEAQWEFACRAGTSSRYSSGESPEELSLIAWFDKNSLRRTHTVGELKANPFGLHDMHGNVWEWVQDAWHKDDYRQIQDKPAISPSGPASGANQRVLRGGHWRSTAYICRSSARYAAPATTYVQNCVGFRVSLDVETVKAAMGRQVP